MLRSELEETAEMQLELKEKEIMRLRADQADVQEERDRLQRDVYQLEYPSTYTVVTLIAAL